MTKQASNKPLISFIIPCFNAANSIHNAVDSINMQKSNLITNKQIEIIIVNDASDDNNKTLDKCNLLREKYNNIKLVNLSKNIGQANARNAGISHAKGKYVGFIDADDVADLNLLPTLEKCIHADYDILLWGLYEEHYDNKKQIAKKIKVTPAQASINSRTEILKHTIKLEEKTLLGYLWNKLFKREIIEKHKIKLPNEHLIEDELFNIDFFKYTESLNCIDKPLYHYRRISINGDTVTSSYLHDYFSQYSKRIQKLYNLWNKENILCKTAKKVLANEYTRFTMSAIWRNSQKESKMNKQNQKSWIEKWYKNKLTIELLEYANPQGKLAKVYVKSLKNHNVSRLLLIAKIIEFTSKYFSKTLIKARQSR